MRKIHYQVRLQGKVQGVGFRYNAKEQADKLNIYGYVRNMRDGTVIVVVEGSEDMLKQFLIWCRNGDYSSHIERLDVEQKEIEGYREFSVF